MTLGRALQLIAFAAYSRLARPTSTTTLVVRVAAERMIER
jgi:hypothetical protein